MSEMQKKYAAVTGCDHGLGLCLARELALRGYTVLACTYQADAPDAAALLRDFPGRVSLAPLDISRDGSVKDLAAAFPFPSLDLLVNNAGILGAMESGPEEDLDYDRILQVINVNAVGPLRVTAALLPFLRKGEGKTILNISSEAGSIADCERTGWFGYCMSKAAGNMQGALIHNSFRREGGKVIQLHPGHMATWMRGHLDTTARFTPEEAARRILATVLDRTLPAASRPAYIDLNGKELPW